jgi:hypothetical protein
LLSDHSGLSPFERLLTLFTRVRPGEGRSAFLFVLNAFLLLFSYQVVKALREAFMLTRFSAEVRAYAVAVIALVLMLLIPAYGAVRRRLRNEAAARDHSSSRQTCSSSPRQLVGRLDRVHILRRAASSVHGDRPAVGVRR